ncbi:MAG: type II toxin-antitoxin system prevent-host-death family antitoxin [Candidatus Omnitrophica bacterium]|nr:type II toxin-antitoxin system prevent-host-death family antitoxin [Candidatus Omnitrophota bacterium]
MIKIGSFEAKTHFSNLLKKVTRGEEILITNRGKIVAKLISCEEKGPDPKLFIKRVSEFNKGRHCSLKEIKEMKEEGRKY